MPRKISLVVVIGVLVGACFERTFDKSCPTAQPFSVNGVCFPVAPDGFTPPQDMSVVACSSSSMCPASLPVCDATQSCAPCSPTGASNVCAMFQPTTPLCGPSGNCVECLTKDNCDAKLQTCKMNACAPCSANTDCTSGLCNVGTGVCVDKTTLLYVNNMTGSNCSDTGPGSFSNPFCTVQQGLNSSALAAGKTVIIFPGQGYAEALSANATNTYTAVAVGNNNPVIKPTGALPAVAIAGSATSGKTVSVSFDGVTFDGSAQTGSTDLIDCTGGAAYGQAVLTITRSTLKASPGIGLSATAKCTVTLDADLIQNNKSGGLLFGASDLALTNLLVLTNGTPTSASPGSNFGGIDVSQAGEAGKMSLANLTILGNQADTSASASAMVCPVAAVKTINTVVFGDVGPATEIQAACIGTVATPQMTNSAYAGGSSMLSNVDITTCSLSLLFTNPANGDYTPKVSAPPCSLVDQGTNVGAPNHDYNGTARPQPTVGGKWDIGAIEAP